MKKVYRQYVTLILFLCFSCTANSASNFIKITLPESVSVDLPKNWVLISDNKRITLDTWVESTFDLNQLPNIDSDLPFAANYYADGVTVGIINVRYYSTIDVTQQDAKLASANDVRELDRELKKNMIPSMNKIGITVTSWEGTQKRTINGITAFVTEYHREALKGDGIFRVRLVRVLAGERSFTLTVSYLESQKMFLENITDKIISSLSITGH